jgi:UDP-N-acetylmuramoyl-tripeptide--D-alanyl-D-alanine ligase
MKEISAAFIAEACQGQLDADANIMVNGVSTDTRTIMPGSLFVAICGERFDGHDYISEALDKGAALVLAEKGKAPGAGVPAVYVDDTVAALGRLARRYREGFNIPVVAITGSVGKTSTKDIIAAALSAGFKVHKTIGNFNNDIGLPLSVLELDDTHEVAVFEMGMRGFGEISRLSHIVRPDVAVITNIGISHIERLGSRQNILKAKLEILHGMDDSGTVVLNGDDELLTGLKGLLKQRTIYYGINGEFDVVGFDPVSRGEEGVAFKAALDGNEYDFLIPAPGMHSVRNALAAISVAHTLGMDPARIARGLKSYEGDRLRMNISLLKGIKVINDSYNAAPASVASALDVLAEIGANHRTWAILGDMLELGDWTEQAHREAGKRVAALGIDYLVAVGEYARWYAEGAREHGMPPERIRRFDKGEHAEGYLFQNMKSGDVMLFKGSRRMKLDALIESLFGKDGE